MREHPPALRPLLPEPGLLLLDEVMARLNATEVERTVELGRAIKRPGVAILLTEHVMRAMMSLAERVIVLNDGARIAEGRPEAVASDSRVIEACLGEMGMGDALSTRSPNMGSWTADRSPSPVGACSWQHGAPMARNDQVIRQWHLLRRLESSAGPTLQELAHGLPDDFPRHLRTLRRDLAALESAGFPLVTERVSGQTRWKLLDGFRRLPALGFAPSELMALVFSRDLLRPLQGTHIHAALDSALSKASAALPPSGLDFVRQMREFLSVRFGPHKTYRAHREVIDRASRAIADRRTVQMRYLSASSGKTGRREVDPYHLWYAAGGLYLIGYCYRRRDVRMFAVERIRSLTITDHPYQLPLGFDVEAYVQDALVVMRGRQIAVELLFDRATAAWARDRIWHPSQELAPLRDGRLRMTLRVADTRELVGWILSFGRSVKVIRPAELRDRVREEARALSRH